MIKIKLNKSGKDNIRSRGMDIRKKGKFAVEKKTKWKYLKLPKKYKM